jgi:hypothetical protein
MLKGGGKVLKAIRQYLAVVGAMLTVFNGIILPES